MPISERPREGVGGVHRRTRPVERSVEGDVAGGNGAGGSVTDDLADAKIFEVVACAVRHFDPWRRN